MKLYSTKFQKFESLFCCPYTIFDKFLHSLLLVKVLRLVNPFITRECIKRTSLMEPTIKEAYDGLYDKEKGNKISRTC